MDPATFSYYHERLQEERWSEWKSLEPADFQPRTIPTEAGLYRVAAMDDKHHLLALTYTGQTGRGLRERVSTLWREVYGEQLPGPAPHVAAPAHWHFRQDFKGGQHFAYSVFELPGMQGKHMREDRELLEGLAITLWRQRYGLYPLVNFGSLAQVSMSERLEFVRAALWDMPQINLAYNDPWDEQWLRLPWSNWQPTTASEGMKQRGIYRVQDTSEHRLAKIGFGILHKGLAEYRSERDDPTPCPKFSWFAPTWVDYQYRALCNDLGSAHVIYHCGLSIEKVAA